MWGIVMLQTVRSGLSSHAIVAAESLSPAPASGPEVALFCLSAFSAFRLTKYCAVGIVKHDMTIHAMRTPKFSPTVNIRQLELPVV